LTHAAGGTLPVGALSDDYDVVELSAQEALWSVVVAAEGSEPQRDVDARRREVVVRPGPGLRASEALRQAVSEVMLIESRLPIHAALVAHPAGRGGLLILGDSGRGKSSLVWLALSMGWRVVSDDMLALHAGEGNETVGATIRKRLRIPAHILDERTQRLGRKMRNHVGLDKTRIQPDAVFPGSFVHEAPIGRIAFLERGACRSVARVSKTEALERLIDVCSLGLAHSPSRAPFQVLSDLARRADAKVARLTKECLSDPRVLEELAS